MPILLNVLEIPNKRVLKSGIKMSCEMHFQLIFYMHLVWLIA